MMLMMLRGRQRQIQRMKKNKVASTESFLAHFFKTRLTPTSEGDARNGTLTPTSERNDPPVALQICIRSLSHRLCEADSPETKTKE